MNHYLRLALVWVFSSLIGGVLRFISVAWWDVWSVDGRLLISPLLYGLIWTAQIAFTGALTFLLMAAMFRRQRVFVERDNG